MARIYVASKFENKQAVRVAQRMLVANGHEITFDWTVHDSTLIPLAERERYLKECAMNDLHGVIEADAILLLCHPNMKGAYVELGAALAMGRRILVVAPDLTSTNIFFHLPCVEVYDTVENAVRALENGVLHGRMVWDPLAGHVEGVQGGANPWRKA
jgi:hypothetical protein